MAELRYIVPKFIEVEDKIIGPFTLKQFLYLVGGGITTYLLWFMLWKVSPFIFFLVALPVLALSGALTFVKVNERPFIYFLQAAINYAIVPKERYWMKIPEIEEIKIVARVPKAVPKEVKRAVSQKGFRSKLEELAMIVDTKGWKKEEVEERELKGRIVSSVEEAPTYPITLEQERELEDVFAGFEKALKVEEEKAPEEELKIIGTSLEEILKREKE